MRFLSVVNKVDGTLVGCKCLCIWEKVLLYKIDLISITIDRYQIDQREHRDIMAYTENDSQKLYVYNVVNQRTFIATI